MVLGYVVVLACRNVVGLDGMAYTSDEASKTGAECKTGAEQYTNAGKKQSDAGQTGKNPTDEQEPKTTSKPTALELGLSP